MDATALRQKVLSNNLANANTPGYIRKDVQFDSALARAIGQGSDAVTKVAPKIIEDQDAPVDAQGNSVSLQKELGALSQNELLYDFAAEMTSQKFGMLHRAITGSK